MNDLDIFDPFYSDPFRRMSRMLKKWAPFEEGFARGVREPLSDLIDEGKTFRIVLEMPGVEKKDINIHVEPDFFTVEAEVKENIEEKQKEKGYYYHERSYRAYRRSFSLPAPVIPEKTTAEMKNGILEVVLVKEKPTVKEGKGFKVSIK